MTAQQGKLYSRHQPRGLGLTQAVHAALDRLAIPRERSQPASRMTATPARTLHLCFARGSSGWRALHIPSTFEERCWASCGSCCGRAAEGGSGQEFMISAFMLVKEQQAHGPARPVRRCLDRRQRTLNKIKQSGNHADKGVSPCRRRTPLPWHTCQVAYSKRMWVFTASRLYSFRLHAALW
jgi:hypothetical protein